MAMQLCCHCDRANWLIWKNYTYHIDHLKIETFYHHFNRPVEDLDDMIALLQSYQSMIASLATVIQKHHETYCGRHCTHCDQLLPTDTEGGAVTQCELEEAVYYYSGLSPQQTVDMDKLVGCLPELTEINGMIGMDSIKDECVNLLKFLISVDPKQIQEHKLFMHMVITGPPGHGKTDIAKLLGRMFSKAGVLQSDKFIFATRADLIGKFCGHTAVQTTEVFDNARGGVVFIDEVYALGNPQKRDVFTKECIDTINQLLSERTDTLCIIAGYAEEIETCFFSYNPGLKRRFPWRFDIVQYTTQHLVDIFYKKMKDMGKEVCQQALEASDLDKHKDKFENAGGDIVNLVTNCILAHHSNAFMNPERLASPLQRADVLLGLERYLKRKHRAKSDSPPPPGMYS